MLRAIQQILRKNRHPIGLRYAHEKKSNVEICMFEDEMVDPSKPEPSVIIIGAGIAGLSAAERLAHCGITNFKIVEALDRPGGRIESCWFGDVITEMGAQCIEGACIGNPVYNLAAMEGIAKTHAPKAVNAVFCASDGRVLDEPLAFVVHHKYKQLIDEAFHLFSTCGKDHGSLDSFLSQRIEQELLNFPEDERCDASRIFYGLKNELRWFMGDDLDQVSADNFGSILRIPGGVVKIPSGFISVLAPLLRALPDCNIAYGKPVNTIKWGTTRGEKGARVVVKCCDGTEFCGDYCIVTIPLGVLKEHANKLFCPQLPPDKQEAINVLGYGLHDKIFLQYEIPFWRPTDGPIHFSWSKEELRELKDWTKGICILGQLETTKNMLVAHIGGVEAGLMEQASEEEVACTITKLLRRFTGDPSIPYPVAITRSKWVTNPYFCGSHSYVSVNSRVEHQCILAAPVPGICDNHPPVLLFAGEAAITGHQGTVHGARISGIREAQRIISLTKKYHGPPPK